jgi:sarcosine oxidase subunit gamma
VRERPFLGHLNVRGSSESSVFRDVVQSVVGVELPLEPNTVCVHDGRVVFWLGPAEWLVTCAGADEHRLAEGLDEGLAGEFTSVVRLGGGQTLLEFGGESARELLAKGCPLDLHPRALPIGRCAQTHVAKAPALLRPIPTGFELIVRRSFADYLWQWFETVVR